MRKRLRSLGLWPKPGFRTKAATSYDAVKLYKALRAAATPTIAPYLQPKHGYDAWQEVNRFTAAAKDDLLKQLDQAADLPRISILTPVYNTPAHHLRALAASIENQIYDDWELCLSDDGSTRRETLALLDDLEASSPRIRVIRSSENRGIAEATNAAARAAVGDVFVFVDHDDLLTPDCLAEVALAFATDPSVDFVYSDDDKIDDDGCRYAPQFKPDFAPVLLLSFMYMSHVVGVRRSLFEAVGGIRKGFEGSQDYDFALRATERARSVKHIPRVLYHWRAAEGSTARSGDAKPASFDAGLRAVRDALARRKIDAVAIHPDWAQAARIGMFSLIFPDQGPSVTIIIPTYNNVHLLRDCVDSLRLTAYADYEVLIVDNGSDDSATLAYLDEVRGRPRHKVLPIERKSEGFNFAALMNEAVRHASGEFVLFLNNDTKVISPSWLSQMVGYGRMENVGSVGARLYFADGTLQHAGIVHGYHEGLAGHAFRSAAPHDWGYLSFVKTAREYSSVTAACMLTRRSTFTQTGGFNEKEFAVAYNDVDYGYRLIAQGMTNVYCPEAELFHYEGKTRNKKDNPKELVNFRLKYGDFVDGYYNPNLSLENERFEISTRRSPARHALPIRTCVVSHNLNFEGAPNTLFDLVTGLKRKGVIDPVVLAPGPGPLQKAYEDAGVEVRLFNAPPAGASAADYRTLTLALSRLFEQLGASVVMANTLPMFFAVNAAHEAGLATIWCQHESEPWATYFDAETMEVRAMAYAAFGQAYRVTYVAEATRQAWAPVQTRQNAQVIRHGLPPERSAQEVARWNRADARRRLGLGDDECVVILMGTVCGRKGQLDLIHAMDAIDPVSSRLRAYIVGATTHDTEYVARLRDALEALPPVKQERIVITGAVDDMTLYYAAADISICTSRIESAPRIIVESMLFSLPILTTSVFGIPELVEEGVNALFYPPGDAGQLASSLSYLIENAEIRQNLAAHSQDVLKSKPAYEEMIAQYSSLLREAALVSSASPPPPPAKQGLTVMVNSSSAASASTHWDRMYENGTRSAWTQNSLVTEALYRRMTDKPGHWLDWLFTEGVPQVDRLLSIGCGDGAHEISIGRRRFAGHTVAFDASPRAIEIASQTAAAENLPVDFSLRLFEDFVANPGPEAAFDAVLFAGSLHHVTDLEGMLSAVRRVVRPGGWVIVNEYIGPCYQLYPQSQVDIVNRVLASIPLTFRMNPDERLVLPNIEAIMANDPTEGVRSALIPTLLPLYFRPEHVRLMAGALLHPLFGYLNGDRINDRSPESQSLTRMLITMEDELTRAGVLQHDFMFGIYRRD